MRYLYLLLSALSIAAVPAFSQYNIHGRITNSKREPLALVSVEVKELKSGTLTREDGTYSLLLEPGKYDLVVSMIGYKSQVLTIIVGKGDYLQDVLLDE